MSLTSLPETRANPDMRLLAQAIALLAFVAAAIAVGWLAVSDQDWYAPALGLIVATRFGYDHFFVEDSDD